MSGKADFSDLTTRAASAVVMLLVAGYAIFQGGTTFNMLLTIASGLMAWEVSRMHEHSKGLAIITGIIVSFAVLTVLFSIGLPDNAVLGIQLLIAVLVSVAHKSHKIIVLCAVLAVIFATSALGLFRNEHGMILTLWLLLCIVASDVGGYFAGKMLGGPKLWVRISPKKTWSGTLGGWVLAAVIGALFYAFLAQKIWLIPASFFVAIAAQSGDLAESALKRRAGIKDSSNLIPGHGGLLDRFDGVLGVCLLISIAGFVGVF